MTFKSFNIDFRRLNRLSSMNGFTLRYVINRELLKICILHFVYCINDAYCTLYTAQLTWVYCIVDINHILYTAQLTWPFKISQIMPKVSFKSLWVQSKLSLSPFQVWTNISKVICRYVKTTVEVNDSYNFCNCK